MPLLRLQAAGTGVPFNTARLGQNVMNYIETDVRSLFRPEFARVKHDCLTLRQAYLIPDVNSTLFKRTW